MNNDNQTENNLDKTEMIKELKSPFKSQHDFICVLKKYITHSWVYTINDYEFTIQDIKILLKKEWLNDKIINTYFTLIEKHNTDVYTFSTYFYFFLTKDGFEKVSKWTKKINIFDFKLILIPVHLSNHWVFVAVDTRNCSIEYFDSMGSYNIEVVRNISNYIEKEQSLKVRYPKSYFRYKKDVPMQNNSYDCGVYVCMYARYRSEMKSSFYSGSMRSFRLQILHEILLGNILYDLDHRFSPNWTLT